MRLTMMETRIVAFALLAIGIAFVILASISYISRSGDSMADEPTEITTDSTENTLISEN